MDVFDLLTTHQTDENEVTLAELYIPDEPDPHSGARFHPHSGHTVEKSEFLTTI